MIKDPVSSKRISNVCLDCASPHITFRQNTSSQILLTTTVYQKPVASFDLSFPLGACSETHNPQRGVLMPLLPLCICECLCENNLELRMLSDG